MSIVPYQSNTTLTQADVKDIIEFTEKNKGLRLGPKTLGLTVLGLAYWASPNSTASFSRQNPNLLKSLVDETVAQITLESSVGFGHLANNLLSAYNPYSKETALALGAAQVTAGFLKESTEVNDAMDYLGNTGPGNFIKHGYNIAARAYDDLVNGGPVEVVFFKLLKSQTANEFVKIVETLQLFDATSKQEFRPGHMPESEVGEGVDQECTWAIAHAFELEQVINNAILSIQIRMDKYLGNIKDKTVSFEIKELLNEYIDNLVSIRVLTSASFPKTNLASRAIEETVEQKLRDFEIHSATNEFGYIGSFVNGFKRKIKSVFSDEIANVAKGFADETLRILKVKIADDPNITRDEEILDFLKQTISDIAKKNNQIEFDIRLKHEDGTIHVYTVQVDTLEILKQGQEQSMELVQSLIHKKDLNREIEQLGMPEEEFSQELTDPTVIIQTIESNGVQIFSSPFINVTSSDQSESKSDILSYEKIMKVEKQGLNKNPSSGKPYDPSNRGIEPSRSTKKRVDNFTQKIGLPRQVTDGESAGFLLLDIQPSELGKILYEPIRQFLESSEQNIRVYTESQMKEKLKELGQLFKPYGDEKTRALIDKYYTRTADKEVWTQDQRVYLEQAKQEISKHLNERTSYLKGFNRIEQTGKRISRFVRAQLYTQVGLLLQDYRKGDTGSALEHIWLILGAIPIMTLKILAEETPENFGYCAFIFMFILTGLPTRIFRIVRKGIGSSIPGLMQLKNVIKEFSVANNKMIQASNKSDRGYAQRIHLEITQAKNESNPVLYEQKLLEVEKKMIVHQTKQNENSLESVKIETKVGSTSTAKLTNVPKNSRILFIIHDEEEEDEEEDEEENRFEVIEETPKEEANEPKKGSYFMRSINKKN